MSMRGGRLTRALASLLGAGFLAMAVGFAWFAHEALQPPLPVAQAPSADGLVVLTGGAGRIETAIRLLLAGRARLLLISGVKPGVDLAELLPPALALNRAAVARVAPRITLGHTASDTIGNAREAAAWARMNDLHSLVVVTASYHMRRALQEIGTALPDVTLHAWPVSPPALTRPLSAHGWSLLGREYLKWLIVTFRLGGSAHLREMG